MKIKTSSIEIEFEPIEDLYFETDGSGLWSDTQKKILVQKFVIDGWKEKGEYQGIPELRVYFDTQDWDISKDGLIYTDDLFHKQLVEYFSTLGVAGEIDYSEQGMQGDDYVSLDCEYKVLDEIMMIFNN